MRMTSTLAYYDTELIAAVKSFIGADAGIFSDSVL
jgi:hypothetical protein